MPQPLTPLQRVPILGLLPNELEGKIRDLGWPKFRAKQVRDWVYVKKISDPSKMTNLSAMDQAKLSDAFEFLPGEVLSRQTSTDGTEKLLLCWRGAEDAADAPPVSQAETVMIPDGDRKTACVSSQVGCPVKCKFCASGIGGLKRSLSAAQIVEQVVALNQILARQNAADRITNVVFMGMGEPLANYANVMQAVRILHDPECLNIGGRRITISTVGVPDKMRELAREELPLNLAISLHAPNEPLRKKLIPWAEHFALDEILSAGRYYFEQTGREITMEYILLAGVNDQPIHAHELARLCRTLRCNVNLIRYNEVAELGFGRPKAQDVVVFQEILRDAGVNAHVRKSRGRDIDAACGQLRRKEEARTGIALPVVGMP